MRARHSAGRRCNTVTAGSSIGLDGVGGLAVAAGRRRGAAGEGGARSAAGRCERHAHSRQQIAVLVGHCRHKSTGERGIDQGGLAATEVTLILLAAPAVLLRLNEAGVLTPLTLAVTL